MTVIRTTRFTVDRADTGRMLERRRRWDSDETLRAALDGAPGLPEAAAAFAVARNVTAEQGVAVDEDVWAR